MKINYDKIADALYISFMKTKVFKTIKMADRLIVDIDAGGKIIGMEILDASSQIPKQKSSKITIDIPAFA